MNVNKVILAGNITKDPEVINMSGGTKKVNMRLAVNRFYNKDGEKNEETTYVNVGAWGRQADFCHQYLKKGNGIHVVGRLSIRSYEKDGQTQYMTEIIAEDVQSMGKQN